jgi:hypothetical protein
MQRMQSITHLVSTTRHHIMLESQQRWLLGDHGPKLPSGVWGVWRVGHFARECPTRLNREVKFTTMPGRRNPRKCSQHAHSRGDKPPHGMEHWKQKVREMRKRCEWRQLLPLNAPDNVGVEYTVSIFMEHDTPTILVEREGMSSSLNLDTSCNVPILQPGISRGDVQVTTLELYGVTLES